MVDETETRKRNRHTSQVPKRVMFWCNKCDMDQVSVYGKDRICSVCGWHGDRSNGNKKVFK